MKSTSSKKIKVFLCILVCLIIILITAFIIKNISFKKLSASITPINTSFDDIEFYACVVNAYNEENNTDYGILTNLSDEQLSTIKKLECSTYFDKKIINTQKHFIKNNGDVFDDLIEQYTYATKFAHYKKTNDYRIKSVKGIEKLSNLQYFSLFPYTGDYNVKSEDLKHNKNLKVLKFTTFAEETSDFSNNENLEEIYRYPSADSSMWQINRITGISGLTKLKILHIEDLIYNGVSYSQYSNIDFDLNELTNLNSLEELYLDTKNIKDITPIKNLENLKSLSIFKGSANALLNTKLSDLRSIHNLTSLRIANAVKDDFGQLSPMLNLKELDLLAFGGNAHFDTTATLRDVDFSLFSNIEYLYLNSANMTNITSLSELNNFDKLTKLKAIDLSTSWIGPGYDSKLDITELNKFNDLKTITSIDGRFTASQGLNNDLTIFPNLKVYFQNDGWPTPDVNSNNVLQNLEQFYGRSCAIFDGFSTPLKLKKVFCNISNNDDRNLSQEAVDKMPDLEYIYASNKRDIECDEQRNTHNCTGDGMGFDFSNNKKLKFVYAPGYGYNELTQLKTLITAYYISKGYFYQYGSHSMLPTELQNKYATNLSKLTDLEYVYFANNIGGSVDLSNNNKLKTFVIRENYNPFATIDLSNCMNLEVFSASFLNVDIKNNNKLIFFIGFGEYNTYKSVVVNTKNNLIDLYNLNSKFNYITHETDSNALVINNGILTSKNTGVSNINTHFLLDTAKRINVYSESIYDGDLINNFNTQLITLDIKSDKLTVNKDEKYILSNGINKEKDIINNIKITPTFSTTNSGLNPNIYSVVHKNEYIINSNRVPILSFKLIKVVSDKYNVLNNSIEYYGNFNKDFIRVTNAESKITNGHLEIIFNGKTIKQYELIKGDNIIGDVNNDGVLSISDLINQYKHVKYLLDLEGNTFRRADINSDDDVDKKDMDDLYIMIKGGN